LQPQSTGKPNGFGWVTQKLWQAQEGQGCQRPRGCPTYIFQIRPYLLQRQNWSRFSGIESGFVCYLTNTEWFSVRVSVRKKTHRKRPLKATIQSLKRMPTNCLQWKTLLKTYRSRDSSTTFQSAVVFKGIMRMVTTSEARVIRGGIDARESGFTSVMSDIINDLYDWPRRFISDNGHVKAEMPHQGYPKSKRR